jgi:hypothetical protein
MLTVQNGVVLDVAAYNDDGAKIVLENSVAGMTPTEALNIFISAFAEYGYITNEGEQASLVITASGDNSEGLIVSLQDTAAQRLTELGLDCEVVVSAVANSIDDEAKTYGLTPGRYLLLKYLAEQEGITLEQAAEKYGSLKMGKLVKLVDDVDDVFGHKDGDRDMQDLVDSGVLSPEQLQILSQAQSEFKTAMQQAQAVFKQTRTQAKELWKNSKTEIQNVFKSDKDVVKWKTAKEALKAQIEQQKQTAITSFKQAKVQAQEQFKTAVKSLGLTDEQIAALIKWGFDYDWDFDYDWGDDQDDDKADQQSSAQDDDEADDDEKSQEDSSDDAGKPADKDKGTGKGDNGNKGKNS